MTAIKYSILFYLILLNLLSFTLCGIDKKRAVDHAWRISERTLLLSGALGGCAGLGIGMLFFHHKTRHTKFKLIVPLECIVWLLILLYFTWK